MPLSIEKFDELQRAIRLALVSTALNEWERKFLRDLQATLARYGPAASLSDQQYRKLMKITRKHVAPKLQDPRRRLALNHRRLVTNGRRSRDWRPAFGLALAAFAFCFIALSKAPERFPEYLGPIVSFASTNEITGRVTHVRDGDTIEVSGIPIRFGSLDCAERNTREGQNATSKMRTLVADQTLNCHLNGRTSYDRKIGSCRLQDGRDLGGIMISEGYCRRFW